MQSTWALHTVNWSTTVPGWLASMTTTLLVVSVLVRIHTRLEVASASGSSLACVQAQGQAGAPTAPAATGASEGTLPSLRSWPCPWPQGA